MLQEYLAIFRRNLPYVVREDSAVLAVFSHERCEFLEKRDENGALSALLCYSDNAILLLCVDKPYRNRGWGSALLALAEERIFQNGFDEVTLGVGFSYLMPGAPTHIPQFPSEREPVIMPEWDDFSPFFEKRGYIHSWDCNCFDMSRRLGCEGALTGDGSVGLATRSQMLAVCQTVKEAHPSFAKYYRNEALYSEDSESRVLAFWEGALPVGALILTHGENGVGLVGCVTVINAFRGQGIAKRLVRYATDYLALGGAKFAFVGYTYSGMERLYGKCGYEISSYYLMGKKKIQNAEGRMRNQ